MPKHDRRVVKIRCMLKLYIHRGDYFRFDSVFIKKKQPNQN